MVRCQSSDAFGQIRVEAQCSSNLMPDAVTYGPVRRLEQVRPLQMGERKIRMRGCKLRVRCYCILQFECCIRAGLRGELER